MFKQSLIESRNNFQKDVFQRIYEIKTMLEQEKSNREEGDEVIVSALNQYTTTLDNAMKKGYNR